MQPRVSRVLRTAMLVSGAVAVWAMDQKVGWVAATFKPLTTVLLFKVVGRRDTSLRRRVTLGLVFSLIGDIALLGQGGVWFQLGLGAFLVTHVCYIVAFLPYSSFQWRAALVAMLGTCASATTVVLAYAEAAKAGVVIPVAVYAAAITGTLVTCTGAIGGPLTHAKTAALGAALFYAADTCIALNVFVPWLSLPHPAVFTTGVYWVGQYCIALAARGGTNL